MTTAIINTTKVNLDLPPLEDVADAFRDALLTNFNQVTVDVRECPDLRGEPWLFKTVGLCGKTAIAGERLNDIRCCTSMV